MSADRYLKVVLTIIAVELGWIAMTHGAQPVAAQTAQTAAAATPVVITGVQMRDQNAFLPVGVMGGYRSPATNPRVEQLSVKIEADRPIRVDMPIPVEVRTMYPVKVEADKPLKIESVPYTPAQRPGE
jgi:hypothetical protein